MSGCAPLAVLGLKYLRKMLLCFEHALIHSLTIDAFDIGAPKKLWAYFEKPTTFCKLKKGLCNF